jgi:hypothetical protein
MATSQALKRVLANVKRINPITKIGVPKMEGIYLSKLQLKTLGEHLINMSSGPDGICFMIGVDGNNPKTIEAIPYKNTPTPEAPNSRQIFNNAIFTLNAGGLDENSTRDLIFDSDGHHKQLKHPIDAEPITHGSQKTPPPFS